MRNRVALDLCGPSRHVAEQIDGERDVGRLGNGQGLAVVETFEISKLLCVLFQQVGQFPNQSSTFGRGQAPPRTIVESIARGLDCLVDIFAIALGDLCQHFASSGIVSWKSFSGRGVHPSSVD